MELKPERIFATTLESERLTYALFDFKNQSHVQFITDIFNREMAGAGPTDGNWATKDIRRRKYSVMMKPSDAHGRRPKDPCFYLVYLLRAPERPIGVISFCRRVPDVPMDLGYSIEPEHQNKGYGTEAAERVNRYWRDEFGVKEMVIITEETNVPARKLAEAIGYVEGGYLKMGERKGVTYVLPGMKKMEGQQITFYGDGEVPDEDY